LWGEGCLTLANNEQLFKRLGRVSLESLCREDG